MELHRLITGAKLGDNNDFSALVRLFQNQIFSLVLGMLKDWESA